MKPDDKNIKWVKEPELGLSGRMYLGPLLDGLATTARHFVKTVRGEAMTRQFPEERPEFGNPLIYRGVHPLNKDDEGRDKCVTCFLVDSTSPAHSIDTTGSTVPCPDR